MGAAKRNRVKRVVFYSTVGVYGKDANFQGDKSSTCQPTSLYTKEILGYQPMETIAEGIRREVEWLYPKRTEISRKKAQKAQNGLNDER